VSDRPTEPEAEEVTGEAVGAAEDTEREARAVARERRRAVGKLERELERLRAKKR
jgi:hypothetical protein